MARNKYVILIGVLYVQQNFNGSKQIRNTYWCIVCTAKLQKLQRLAGDHLFGKLLFTWLSLVMSMLVSFVLSFFPRDVLDEILNLIGSVSEGFPSYSSMARTKYVTFISVLYVQQNFNGSKQKRNIYRCIECTAKLQWLETNTQHLSVYCTYSKTSMARNKNVTFIDVLNVQQNFNGSKQIRNTYRCIVCTAKL